MKVVMYQQWHHLLFLHWKIETEQLRSRIPKELEIDTFNGDAYVGVVLFTMKGIRPRLLRKMPFAHAFHEFNLRTYVRSGDQTGVWFFSLDAANSLAVRAARSFYSLPYFLARMSVDCCDSAVRYKSERIWPPPVPAQVTAIATFSGDATAAEQGTLEHFLVERYKLFAERRGRILDLAVRHEPYLLREVVDFQIQESLTTAAGLSVTGPPICHYSDRVDADILRLRRV